MLPILYIIVWEIVMQYRWNINFRLNQSVIDGHTQYLENTRTSKIDCNWISNKRGYNSVISAKSYMPSHCLVFLEGRGEDGVHLYYWKKKYFQEYIRSSPCNYRTIDPKIFETLTGFTHILLQNFNIFFNKMFLKIWNSNKRSW